MKLIAQNILYCARLAVVRKSLEKRYGEKAGEERGGGKGEERGGESEGVGLSDVMIMLFSFCSLVNTLLTTVHSK